MTRNDRRTSARRFASPKFVREGGRAYTSFFTGKPAVTGLGHAFLMRNYRAGLGKWQTADPMGYPDGWNAMAYCGNGVTGSVDLWGCSSHKIEAKDGVRENGYTSAHGLGCWYLLEATCSGSYENLDITYTIARRDGSQTTFSDEVEIDLPNIGKVYDPCAKYSGFSSKTQNLKRIPDKREDINELTVEFDWIVEYTVNVHYTYEAIDPNTGESIIIIATMDVPRSVKKHVVLNCYHRKMGE